MERLVRGAAEISVGFGPSAEPGRSVLARLVCVAVGSTARCSSGKTTRSAATVALAVLAGFLAACGGGAGESGENGAASEASSGETQTFEHQDFDIEFSYPQELELEDDFSFRASGSGPEASVGDRLGQHDYFVAQRFKLNAEITEENIDQFMPEADAVFGGGQDVSGERIEVGGFPALRYEVDAPDVEDGVTESIVILDGATEYLLTCASTPAHRELIDAACDTAVETLEPTGQ